MDINKSHKIFHFDEHYIKKICTSLESEIDNLKVIKNQSLPLKTPDAQYFKAALFETETITLLELPSLLPTSIKNKSEVQIKIKESSNYVLSDTVQTSRYFHRTQHSQTEPITLKDQSNVATIWILQKEKYNDISFIKKQDRHPNVELNNFKKMVSIMDRIVTSNIFSENQIKFLTCHKEINTMSYRYILEEILTFSNDKLANFAVTSFLWNTVNEDILAVGYGKWNDIKSPNIKGIICCWSLKNPVYPERMYEFDEPITCLDFSKTNSNILIAGNHGGVIYTLDITQEHCVPIIANKKYLQNFPIWSIVSFLQTNFTSENEFILSVDGNGSVRKWSTFSRTSNTEQMSLIYCGIRKDDEDVVKMNESDLSIVQNMSGTVITFHPIIKSKYFVGTKIGFVVQNTIDSCNHYDSIYMAHNGPVYGIKFSPFCSNIYITYGADWQIKIWMENIESPILSLCYCNAVDDADWSPINSTVIVSVSGANICIWDFARKTVEPVMIYSCGIDVHFTLVKFSKHGNNIITGDVNGIIRCYHINDMPSQSILQKNSILTALENMMSNQELIQKIKNIMLNK